MSSHTRKGRQARANIIHDDIIAKKAKDALSSLNHSSEPERVREVWQQLRQTYEDTVNNNSDTHRPFPIWARSQVEPGKLNDLLTKGYIEDHVRVSYLDHQSANKSPAPSVSQHFKVEPWEFVLHFDYIGLEKAQAIKKIAKQRPKLTFNELYEEVQKNRLNRIKHQMKPKYEFLPDDFEACLKESNNADGSNAEYYRGAEQNQAEYEEGNHNGNPENGYPAPVSSTYPNSHENDYTAGHDDQEDDLEPLSDLIHSATSHSIPPRVSSLPIMTRDRTDETDGDGEVATPIPPTPQAANVAIRRGLSREQSSPCDPLSDDGIFSSTEEELFQDKRSNLLDYESLKASMKKANEKKNRYIKRLKEEQVGYAEKLKQVALNANGSYEEDIQPALDGIGYKLGKNLKKRKFWEGDKEEGERVVAELENPGQQAYFKKAAR